MPEYERRVQAVRWDDTDKANQELSALLGERYTPSSKYAYFAYVDLGGDTEDSWKYLSVGDWVTLDNRGHVEILGDYEFLRQYQPREQHCCGHTGSQECAR